MTEQLDLANITDQISQLLSESTQARRTTRGRGRRGGPAGSRLKDLDPQVLYNHSAYQVKAYLRRWPIGPLAGRLCAGS